MIPLNKLRSSKGYGQNLAAINVNLIKDDWAKLRRYADLLGTSAGEIVRELITSYINSELDKHLKKEIELLGLLKELESYLEAHKNELDEDQLGACYKQQKGLQNALSFSDMAITILRTIK